MADDLFTSAERDDFDRGLASLEAALLDLQARFPAVIRDALGHVQEARKKFQASGGPTPLSPGTPPPAAAPPGGGGHPQPSVKREPFAESEPKSQREPKPPSDTSDPSGTISR